MRIGKFAEANKLSIDTIRHYMDLGLIIPEKQGGQYSFDDRCQEDLKNILSMKDMGFTLNEIKSIFMFIRLGKLTPYQEDEYYKAFYINKHNIVEKQIQELTDIKKKLEVRIQELSQNVSRSSFNIGIDIRILSFFKCLKCSGDLELLDGNIKNNQIIDGKLKCTCGEEYDIQSGILIANKFKSALESKFNDEYIRDYINVTDIGYLENLYEGLEWTYKKASAMNLKNKVILELGSGVGFFLRNIYKDLPDDCLYIAVDHDINRHRFLKSMLQMAECKKNIIFICSDFLQIPIKKKSIDILLDLSGTSNYSFDHDEFLLQSVDGYMKDDAYLLGAYILFKNFAANSLIKDNCRKNFTLKCVKERIAGLKYNIIDEKLLDYVDKGGRFEDYFVKGEKVFSYLYLGKR